MDVSLVIALLLAALLHASWNALVKVGGDGLLTFFLFKAGALPIAGAVLVFTGLPNMACLPYAVASSLTLLAYSIFLGHAYQRADFSLVYPIARGVAPVGVAVLAMVFAGERLTGMMLAGTAVVSAGIMLLAYARRLQKTMVLGLLSAAGVGIAIATYTLFDGIGARVSGDAIAYMALLNIASFLPLGVYVLLRRRRDAMALVVKEWRHGLIGGCIMYLAYGIVIYALTRAPMASVAALRETSVIIAALIGTRMLNEPFGVRRFIAACAVALGVAVIIMSRG
jgi:drug/metabolite transporter (DMT)-like permease